MTALLTKEVKFSNIALGVGEARYLGDLALQLIGSGRVDPERLSLCCRVHVRMMELYDGDAEIALSGDELEFLCEMLSGIVPEISMPPAATADRPARAEVIVAQGILEVLERERESYLQKLGRKANAA